MSLQSEQDGCGEHDRREERFRALIVSRGAAPLVLEAPEHNLDAIAPLVVFNGLLAGLPARDADLYPLVSPSFSEQIGIIALIC